MSDEMGLGKTLQSLLYVSRHPDIKPIIVVCPASLKWNWSKEAVIHFGMRSEILESMTPPRMGIQTPHQLVIINYDILGPWISYIKELKPKLIILDECHFISNPDSKRTKNVTELCKGVPHVIALSGTPLTNRPIELYPVLKILKPDLFPSRRQYAARYCAPRRVPWGDGWDFRGASHLGELHATLKANVMIRRTKEEVLPDLPSKQRSVILFKLPNMKEYEQVKEDYRSWLSKHNPEAMGRAERVEELVKIGQLRRMAGYLKIPLVIEWVSNFLEESDEKLVLFGIHKKVIGALEKKYKTSCVVIDGDTPTRQRDLLVDKFRSNKKTRLFIGNIQAAGVGINLQVASKVAFCELAWRPADHTQAEARCNRIGSINSLLVYYLIAKGTLEERLINILHRKQMVLDQTLDGEKKKDDYDQLVSELRKEVS